MKKWSIVTAALLTAVVLATTNVPETAFAANTSQGTTSQDEASQNNATQNDVSQNQDDSTQTTTGEDEKNKLKDQQVTEDTSTGKKQGQSNTEQSEEIAAPTGKQTDTTEDNSDKKDVKTASGLDAVDEAFLNWQAGIYVETSEKILCIYSPDDSLKTTKVNGISYNEDNGEITLKGYKGGSIAVYGIEDVVINVASASTITSKGYYFWDNTCLYLGNTYTRIKGSGKLTIKGTRYYDEDDQAWYYPDGIDFNSLDFENANVYISNVYDALFGLNTNNYLGIYNSKITITGAKSSSIWLRGDDYPFEIFGGKISGGYSLQNIGNYYILGKSGLYFDNDNDLAPSNRVAKTVTITGGTAISSDDEDDYKWNLNKGVLTINGEGKLGPTYSDTVEYYGWDDYSEIITSVVVGEGITAIDINAFELCSNLKSITLPASLEEFNTDLYSDQYDFLKEVKVSSKNSNFTSISGVLFSKDKKTLIYYPEGRTAKSYTIPNGTTTLGEYALSYAPITTLVLPKSLTEITGYEHGSWAIWGEDIKYIKVTKGNTQFMFNNNMLLTTDNKDLLWYAPDSKDMVVHIPNGVEKIYADFSIASYTRCIYIPDSVTTVSWSTFYQEEKSNKQDVFFEGIAPTILNFNGEETDLTSLAHGNVNIICDCSKEGWSAISSEKELNFKLIDCNNPDSYYPSKLWFKTDADGEVYVGEEAGSIELGYESEDANIEGLIVTSSNTNGLKVSYDGKGTITYEGLMIGNYTIQAMAINGSKATYKVKVTTEFEEESAELVIGEKYTNKLPGIGKTKVTYVSSDSKVASVDKNGKVTAKKEGDCTITAKFLGEETYYDITVDIECPGSQNIYLSGYNYSGNYFVLTIENGGLNNFIVKTKYAFTEDCDDSDLNRYIKSKGTFTVKPGKVKKVKFYVSGSKLKYYDEYDEEWYIYDHDFATLYFDFTYCGVDYSGKADDEGGQFYDDYKNKWVDFDLESDD